MAPIPEDNQEKPPHREDEDLNAFSNGNLTAAFGSESSDENDDNFPDTAGYMLLPQEPGGDDEESDQDIDNDFDYHHQTNGGHQDSSSTIPVPDHLSDDVIHSEGGAIAPTVTASSTTLHPEFLAKFPDGKVPSYMQVPDVPSNSKDVLWNKKRPEKSFEAEESNILKAMSGFSLPSENIPEWAKNMSEDQWSGVVTQQISSPNPNSENKDSDLSSAGDSTQKQEEWIAEFPDS